MGYYVEYITHSRYCSNALRIQDLQEVISEWSLCVFMYFVPVPSQL